MVKNMTKTQIKRLRELEDNAISVYLLDTDFSFIDWLDKKDQKEYCKLYNLQFDEKNCICGTHKLWQ